MNNSAYLSEPNQWVDQLGLTPLNATGVVYGCIAGAVGGYTTGDWKSAAIGCVAGGAVGAVNHRASHAVSAGVSSMLGQGVGLFTAKKEVTNIYNYDAGAVVGAMFGGGIGGSVNKAMIQRAPYMRVYLMNKPLGTSEINPTPGKLGGALLESKITGAGELIGTGKISFPSCAK